LMTQHCWCLNSLMSLWRTSSGMGRNQRKFNKHKQTLDPRSSAVSDNGARVSDIVLVNSVKLLSVYFFKILFDLMSTWNIFWHCLISGAASLKHFVARELPSQHTNTVFQSPNRLAYALPAWEGFRARENINKINSFWSMYTVLVTRFHMLISMT
jgi:hypothetical protein